MHRGTPFYPLRFDRIAVNGVAFWYIVQRRLETTLWVGHVGMKFGVRIGRMGGRMKEPEGRKRASKPMTRTDGHFGGHGGIHL